MTYKKNKECINYYLVRTDQCFADFSTTKPINAPTMSLEEAVRVIQIAERARQGRLRAKLNRESRNMNWMYRTDDPGAGVAERAAVCIQKVFKNHPT